MHLNHVQSNSFGAEVVIHYKTEIFVSWINTCKHFIFLELGSFMHLNYAQGNSVGTEEVMNYLNETYLRIFFARTSRSSHFRSILSPRDASVFLRGRFPFRDSFPFLLTLLSSELMHNLFESIRSRPPKFVSGFRSTGEDIVALWNDADPSTTGCSTVPLTYICLDKKKVLNLCS